MTFATRFAPSPTGPLHLGHAFSALLAHDMASARDGVFLLRIEDIDRTRARPEWEALIFEDLRWLGLDWPEPVMRQSQRLTAYRDALGTLWRSGLVYPCGCNRKDILSAASAPNDGEPTTGPDGIVYPGTCRPAPGTARPVNPPEGVSLRLDMEAALDRLGRSGGALAFEETGPGPLGERGSIDIDPDAAIHAIGDVVLARRDLGTSYHLAVVVDDAAQAITDVVRGQDLFEATRIHIILQRLLGLPTPRYHHHRLIRDEAGRRLAKRDDARAIRTYREDGASPADIRQLVGL